MKIIEPIIVFTLILAQTVAVTGYGQFLPWSIPAFASTGIRDDGVIFEYISIIMILLTDILGLMCIIF